MQADVGREPGAIDTSSLLALSVVSSAPNKLRLRSTSRSVSLGGQSPWLGLVVRTILTLTVLFATYSQTSSAPRPSPRLLHLLCLPLLRRPIHHGSCLPILPFPHMLLPTLLVYHLRLCHEQVRLHDLLNNKLRPPPVICPFRPQAVRQLHSLRCSTLPRGQSFLPDHPRLRYLQTQHRHL